MKKTVLHDEKVFRADAVERENFFFMQNSARHAELTSGAALPRAPVWTGRHGHMASQPGGECSQAWERS